LGEFASEEINNILLNAGKLKVELKSSKDYYILETENKNSLLSLIKLSEYPNIIEQHSDISKAIERRIISAIKHDKFYRGYSQIAEKLKGQIRKLKANITLYSDNSDAIEREQAYRQYAELLASQPNIKDKSGDSITLDSWDGNRLTIPLDPKLNILQNSAKYFDKARRAKESVVHRKKLLPGMQKQLAEAETKLTELETAHSLKDIENIGNKGKKMQDQNDNSSKYKIFELGEGYTLYVGKSAANNDELTMRFAKANDLWFHSRGSSGSHCILKASKDDKVPKNIIQEAAQIAAYYSKSKNAKYTPVCYTYKKYVRKPKGADIGSVTIQREEVIMVEPKLPEGGE
jgi:predicted ribosome quality control (RQC) complex YloA/Tae2 family protein